MADARCVGEHLIERLVEIGIGHLFGVPGDFNLVFLDLILAHEKIGWVGNANELNAAYAADAYARCRGAAALLTTFGVGELSAINGVAGSFAEHVPVLHIVGAPSIAAQVAGEVLHHSLGDGDFRHFLRAGSEVTVAQASLSEGDAAEEIDRVIGQMLLLRRPGYIALPADMVRAPVRSDRGRLRLPEAVRDASQMEEFRRHAAHILAASRHTVLLADFLVDRYGVRAEAERLAHAGGYPSATLLLGKGALDESQPTFIGTYVGAASEPEVRKIVEGADVVITAGVRFTDVITAGFRHHVPRERTIDLQPFEANVVGSRYPGVPLRDALVILTELAGAQKEAGERVVKRPPPRVEPPFEPEAPITQARLWPVLESWLRADDVVLAEQGTAYFGIGACRFPAGVRFLGQPLWGSIGYAIPAAFGAGTGLPSHRVIALIGDGSALLTAQEIGSMLRDGLKPVLIVLNNQGYTVERAIHGPEQRYNDIPQWDWQLLPKALGPGRESLSLQVRTMAELRAALDTIERAQSLVLLEIILPKQDVPQLLASIVEGVSGANNSR